MSKTGHRNPPSLRAIPAVSHLDRPVYARVERFPANSETPPHDHDWGQFSYAITGVLEVHTESGSYLAPPECAVWIPAGVRHHVGASEPAEMRGLYLRRDACAVMPGECRVLSMTPLVRELILAAGRLPRNYDEDGPGGRLVAVLLDELATLPSGGLSLPWPTDPRLRRLGEALRRHPEDSRALADFAAAEACSERTLARRFREQTGLSFREWRQRLRLMNALPALEAGTSVTRVALDNGYASVSAFIAAFKQRFGYTPSALSPRRQGPSAQR